LSILDSIFKPLLRTLKQPIESFIRLETADSDFVLAAEDGSLISVLRVDGSYQIIGRVEYERILSDAVVKFGSKFDKPGHAMQVYFARNPDLIKAKLKALLEPNRATAENAGLEIGDIFDEKEKHLSKFLASEEIYFVLWSRPSALTKSDWARDMEASRKTSWVVAPEAQHPFVAMQSLRTKHTNFTSSIHSSLNEVGIKSEMLEVHDALRAIKMNLYQANVNSAWSPCLPGDPIPARAPENRGDVSEILWPSLRHQIATYPAKIVNDHTIEMGNYLWSGVDLVLAPQEPTPFPALLNRLNEDGIPFRISFLIEGGGIAGMAMQSFLTSLLSVTNSVNKQIKYSIEGLAEQAKSEPIVKMRVSFATWAPKGKLEELENRLSALIQSIESWGYAQASYVTGDALDCIMSSAMGIACASTAPPAIAPLYEVLKLLPWQRGASPFRTGAILLRTPDGRVWPYQTGTNLTTTWFDLVFAQPGGGKSVLMNSLNMGTCLSAGVADLPFIAVIDIGPSSSGLISLIRDALPPEKRYQAVSHRLQMSQEYAINPFDTKLGMRVPQSTERSFLIELLVMLCTPAGQKDPYDGIPQLASMVVDEMYRWRGDSESNAEPRPYLPRVDYDIDKIIAENKIELGSNPYWWDVVDALFDRGMTYEAGLAQRYAVPTLGDAVAAARRPQIRNLLEETKIGAGSEGVIHAFERMVTSAVREFPILSSVTRFALNENRICSLDLADVCPQGDSTADRQTAIMYMLARHVLVTPWWINEEALVQMPAKYRPYHEQKLRDFAETPKRLCYDEFHRTSSSKSVRGQLVRDVREGRKRGVQIVLASQMLQDFDDDMVDLATGVWILGAAISDNAIDDTQKTFGLTETARWIIRHRLTGPKASGAPCLFVLATVDGKYEQFLINTLGPIELWAFSTSAEDVAIRNRLYHRLGAAQARKLLAQFYPGGSARTDIRRRVAILTEKGEDLEKASVGAIIDQIADEITNFALERVTQSLEDDDKKDDEGDDGNGGSSGGSVDDEGPKRDELRAKKYTKGIIGGLAAEETANKGSTHLVEKTMQAAKAAAEAEAAKQEEKKVSESIEISNVEVEPEPLADSIVEPVKEEVIMQEPIEENIAEPEAVNIEVSETIEIEPIPELSEGSVEEPEVQTQPEARVISEPEPLQVSEPVAFEPEPQMTTEAEPEPVMQEPVVETQIMQEPEPVVMSEPIVSEPEPQQMTAEPEPVMQEPVIEPQYAQEPEPVQYEQPQEQQYVEPQAQEYVQEPAQLEQVQPDMQIMSEPMVMPEPMAQEPEVMQNQSEPVMEQPEYVPEAQQYDPALQPAPEFVTEPQMMQVEQAPLVMGEPIVSEPEPQQMTAEPEPVQYEQPQEQQYVEPQAQEYVQEPVPQQPVDTSGFSLEQPQEQQYVEPQAQEYVQEPVPQQPVDTSGFSLEQPQEQQYVEPQAQEYVQEPVPQQPVDTSGFSLEQPQEQQYVEPQAQEYVQEPVPQQPVDTSGFSLEQPQEQQYVDPQAQEYVQEPVPQQPVDTSGFSLEQPVKEEEVKPQPQEPEADKDKA